MAAWSTLTTAPGVRLLSAAAESVTRALALLALLATTSFRAVALPLTKVAVVAACC